MPLRMIWASMILLACGGGPPRQSEIANGQRRADAEEEYRLLRSELTLAEIDSLYLVVDFPQRRLELKRRGVPVWSCDLRIARADSPLIAPFVARYSGRDGGLVRVLEATYLYGGREKIPPQTLEVVSNAINVNPEAIQRLEPERFLVSLGDRLFLDAHTDVKGTARSRVGNALRSMETTWAVARGGVSLKLTMTGDEGLSLREALYRGMPVLLIPHASAR